MKAKLGPYHQDTLESLNNLPVKALKAFGLTKQLYLDTLQSMNNLAEAYQQAGKLDLALSALRGHARAAEGQARPRPPRHAANAGQPGRELRDAGRLDDAIPLLEDALDRATKRPGPFPVQLAWLPLQPLRTPTTGPGGSPSPNRCTARPWTTAAKQFGPDDPRTAGVTAMLGLNLLRQHKDAEAEALLRACLAVRQKQQPDAWTTFNTQSLLGDSLLGQKKYAEAEALLLAGYEGMEKGADKIPLQGKLRLPEAAERLVRLYDALDRPDKADAWREKLEAAKAATAPAEPK